jgi:hypothetical protein
VKATKNYTSNYVEWVYDISGVFYNLLCEKINLFFRYKSWKRKKEEEEAAYNL